jgi:hypothetical protein
MRKGSGTKTRICISIDKDTADEISRICEKKLMKVSSFIESLIKRGLK